MFVQPSQLSPSLRRVSGGLDAVYTPRIAPRTRTGGAAGVPNGFGVHIAASSCASVRRPAVGKRPSSIAGNSRGRPVPRRPMRTDRSESLPRLRLRAIAIKKKSRVTIETAIDAYLRDARSRELESSTLSKLEGIFRSNFCPGAHPRVTSSSMRSIWMPSSVFAIPGPMAPSRKKKKQERVIGFFWACIRTYPTNLQPFG